MLVKNTTVPFNLTNLQNATKNSELQNWVENSTSLPNLELLNWAKNSSFLIILMIFSWIITIIIMLESIRDLFHRRTSTVTPFFANNINLTKTTRSHSLT